MWICLNDSFLSIVEEGDPSGDIERVSPKPSAAATMSAWTSGPCSPATRTAPGADDRITKENGRNPRGSRPSVGRTLEAIRPSACALPR